MTVDINQEVFTKDFPTRPGRYIRRSNGCEELMTVIKKGPLDLIYIIDGMDEDNGDNDIYLRSDKEATYCKVISANFAEVCYAEGWHAAQYAAQKLLGSYFPSYWNDDTVSKKLAE